MAKLSIVVPVYNVQDYIDECVRSIIDQKENDIEIVLVDDGSTDQSGKICDSWAERTSQIIVVHKENGGLSSARNAGLEKATGEYILFVDSDDRIAAGSLTAILDCIEETSADYYFLSGKKFYPDGKEEPLDDPIPREDITGKKSIDVVRYIAGLTKYPGSACTKAYKRDFLEKNSIRFPSDRRIAEDLGFTLRCILAATSFDVCAHDYYLYRQSREGSITSATTGINKSFWNLAIFIKESISQLSENHEPKGEKEKYALSLVAYEYSVALVHFCRVTERVDEAYSLMKDAKWLKNYLGSKRGKIISLLLSTLGIRTTSKLLSYAYLRRERINNR